MLALGLKTMKRPLRSPDGEAASMVPRDGFCNPRWEFRGHHCCGASLPTWLGRLGMRKKGAGLTTMLYRYREQTPSPGSNL